MRPKLGTVFSQIIEPDLSELEVEHIALSRERRSVNITFPFEVDEALSERITEKIKDCRSLELTFFTQDLTEQQMNMLVKIDKKHEFPISLKGCLDCIAVIKLEQERKKASVPISDMSDEEFMNLFKKNQ